MIAITRVQKDMRALPVQEIVVFEIKTLAKIVRVHSQLRIFYPSGCFQVREPAAIWAGTGQVCQEDRLAQTRMMLASPGFESGFETHTALIASIDYP